MSFCANSNFQRNLRLIDLSGNKFKSVPFNIYRLRELVTLKVADNPELVRLAWDFNHYCWLPILRHLNYIIAAYLITEIMRTL